MSWASKSCCRTDPLSSSEEPTGGTSGYDLTGLFVGSEGTFGICTRVIVRLTRNPAAYRTLLGIFETVDAATHAISNIIGAGIIPAALEMMDQGIVEAVEAAFHFGFPLDAGAVLLIEVDGLEVAVDEEAEKIVHLCQSSGAGSQAGDLREGADAPLEMPQTGLWSDRPLKPELLHAGRRCSADALAGDPGAHHRVRRPTRHPHRQRVSRGRRQHPSHPAFR